MNKCPTCGWQYDEASYAIDQDAEGNDLVPYHGYAGRPFSLLKGADAKKRPCQGSMQLPAEDGAALVD